MPAETASARLFLALWPTPSISEALHQHDALWRWPDGARRVPSEHWHITLHFIGAVPVPRIPELQQGLAIQFGPFDLMLDRTALWPGGLAVIGSSSVPEAMSRLHAELAGALRSLALPVETRAFRPHVTLARKAQGALRPPAFTSLRWRADAGYWLVRSLPEGGGYQRLHPFGAAS
jgi:2'-5' RNA ligase